MTDVAVYMSVKALSQLWDCHGSVIYRLVKSGRIPALHVGEVIRIPIAAVEAYEAENTTGTSMDERQRVGGPAPSATPRK